MTYRFSVWALAFFFALDLTVQAKEKEKEIPLPAPPPMAQGHNVTMYRGRTIQIPLHAVGRAPGQVRFLIRTQPRYGKLGPITVVDWKNAIVTYTHDEQQSAGVDSFTFAVQAPDSAVSAAGSISITVSEEPPAFSVVRALEFGQVMLGETRSDEITLRNTGGGTLVGRMTAPPPWKILGPSTYRLGRHEEQKVNIVFAPVENTEYYENLQFSHDARTTVILTGTGFAPLSSDPENEIELKAEKGSTERTRELVIRNRTDRPRLVEIETPPNIVEPPVFTLAASSEQRVRLSSKPNFIEGIEGNVTISSESYRKVMPLHAYPLEASLEAEPKNGFDFGEIESARRYKEVLRLKNTGGLEARITAELPAGLILNPDPASVIIAPGETRAFEVTFEPFTTGENHGEIVLGVTRGHTLRLPVIAKVTAPASASLQPSTAQPSQHAKVVEEPATSDKPESVNDIPEISDIRLRKATPHEIELSWNKPAANALGTLVEYRQLKPTDDGPPKMNWVEWRGAKFLEENGQTIARFDNLPAGRVWYIRIFSIDEQGKRSVPSSTIQLASMAGRDWHLGWWLLGVLILGAGIFVGSSMLRQGQDRAREEDARITRLEKSK
jgi:Abnormal spindle-like microcephaly-assoc'd, ASPM-SPD-2-Hydin